jgi:hypothetical protein
VFVHQADKCALNDPCVIVFKDVIITFFFETEDVIITTVVVLTCDGLVALVIISKDIVV